MPLPVPCPHGETLPDRDTSAPEPGAGVPAAIRWLFPAADGRCTRLSSSSVVLGREGTTDARLEGPSVSRRHAEVRREGPLVIVRDLGSTNGVSVNGALVELVPLAVGDRLRLGDWVGLVVDAASAGDTCTYREWAPGLAGGPVLAPIVETLRKVAPEPIPVLLEGETGTGKECIAKALHTWSGRRGPFVAVNCSAIPEALAEGQLFGYRKGAYSGASNAHLGPFREANGGTLLLDEVSDLPLAIQGKLLRVLEEKQVQGLSEPQSTLVDLRIIAATQLSLADAARAGTFRQDLFFRLHGFPLRLPPLRERVAEIPYLFFYFLQREKKGQLPTLKGTFLEQLCLYDWPGNVRELLQLVRRLVILHAEEPVWGRAQLPRTLVAHPSGAVDPAALNKEHLAEALRGALRQAGGNLARAAEKLGITRQRAYRLVGEWNDFDLEALRSERGKVAPGRGK